MKIGSARRRVLISSKSSSRSTMRLKASLMRVWYPTPVSSAFFLKYRITEGSRLMVTLTFLLFIPEKSYSVLIVKPLFLFGSFSGRNYPYFVLSFGVNHDENPALSGEGQKDVAIFVFRVIRIVKIEPQRILETGGCFLERNPMLLDVLSGFVRIPLELHDLLYIFSAILSNRFVSGKR